MAALLAVYVLGIAEAQILQVLAGQPDLAVGAVERDGQAAVFVDVCDLAAGAVLDAGCPGGLCWAMNAIRSASRDRSAGAGAEPREGRVRRVRRVGVGRGR